MDRLIIDFFRNFRYTNLERLLAQLVELPPYKRIVIGSSPVGPNFLLLKNLNTEFHCRTYEQQQISNRESCM